ncbi:LLM class flavin-dependent oxidoreductase, partial [Actinacidiphila epipremni]
FLRDPQAGEFAHRVSEFDIRGRFNVPRSPQGRPVVFQAGDSDQGREFAASGADAIFSRHGTFDAGRAFYADVKGRLATYGRRPEDLLILPAATFVLGDTPADAAEKADVIRHQQVSGATAIAFLERVWNRDLSGYDPEGPLPDVEPLVEGDLIAKGRADARGQDLLATVARWRQVAEEGKLSIRELVIAETGRQNFIGTAAQVAAEINEFVQTDASDGFILVPHLTPGGLDEFADTVVPLLQERGVFRTEYTGETLRDHLGLPALTPPAGRTRTQAAARA